MVDKNDVVIEKVNVYQRNESVGDEGEEVSNKAWTVSFVKIIEKFEKVTVLVLICDVNDSNQSKIEYAKEAVPGKSFAQKSWEAENLVLRYFDDLLHKNEGQSAR